MSFFPPKNRGNPRPSTISLSDVYMYKIIIITDAYIKLDVIII